MKKLILVFLLSPLLLLTSISTAKAACIPLMPGNICTTSYCNSKGSYYCCDSVTDCTKLGGTASNPTCSNKNDPEFHSLRPYPYQPCVSTTANYATFCGNNLTIQDTITESYPGSENCTTNGNTITCNYNVSVNKPITIDLSQAKLPFMGNTENVKNSTNSTDSLDNAAKINDYVSWYLNGTTNRAEYGGTPTNSDVINYSGPINKLLPGVMLDAQRIQSIKNVSQNVNHDQIAVCASSNWGIIGDLTGIGSFSAIPCYSAGLSEKDLRLSDWQNGSLSIANTIGNFLTGLTPSVVQNMIGHQWNKRTPPLPWGNDPFTGKPITWDDYQKYYNEWRGNSCATVPIVNKTICINNPLVSDKWASLFPYVPLSSTEDLKGNIKVDSAQGVGVSVTGAPLVTNVAFSNQTPATLFFAHVQESSQLGSLLQSTYVPQGQDKIGNPTEVSDSVTCNPVEVRSNPGDSLVNGSSTITGNLSYDATLSCNFTTPPPNTYEGCMASCSDPNQTGHCESRCSLLPPEPTQTCEKNVDIVLATESNSPKLNDVWSQLVAGPMAVVKRLFPKLGTQIGTLEDIPGSTNITYTGASADTGTINIPHVGGIDEYFLNGIQTLLRPKGFGEPITFGAGGASTNCSPGQTGTIPNLPGGSCKLKSTSIVGITLPPTLVKIIETAAAAHKVPPSLILGIMYGEGDFNPGRYNWTEQNVQEWSKGCVPMPNCSEGKWPSNGAVPFQSEDIWNQNKDTSLDSTRTPDPCNLVDAIFAAANFLETGVSGAQNFAGKTCFGIPLNPGGNSPGSCSSWGSSDYETAIKVWETGYLYSCLTKEGSCAGGGGMAAACGNGDSCETIKDRYSNASHNACIWDVVHSH